MLFETTMEIKNGLFEKVHLSCLSDYDKGQLNEDIGEKSKRKGFWFVQGAKGSLLCLEHSGVGGPRW